MIRGAVFDMDGTLLDSMGIWTDVGIRYLTAQHIKAEENLGDILFPMSLEQGAAYLKTHYLLPESTEKIRSGILSVIHDFYVSEVRLKRGADVFLRELSKKGIPIAAATSSDRSLIEAACRRLDIFPYFQQILTCSEVGEGKDSPRIYLEAASCLHAVPGEIFVFEDALHALTTAKQAGFCTAAVYDASSAENQLAIRQTADIYLSDLSDFSQFWETVCR